ncbi:lysozyme-like [Acanthaster planci]|uniref:lysozyme n=1 Tax=Acanthaster planci TaxID=133434 RepID=A0A8B7Y8C0_ACAPL|nr:lysozyme-like [Acanthaster planci]
MMRLAVLPVFGFVVLMIAEPCMLTSVNASAGPVPYNCMHCICIVESNCKMPNPVCHMDVGSLSCGPYQIKKAYWNDARLKGGSLMGDWKKCTATFTCSEDAVQGYMERYAIYSRLGHNPTCEDFARIHNGGPNGFKNPATIPYWDKVKNCLERK